MKDSVLIKGNSHGLSVYVNDESSFDVIKNELQDKLKAARNFFGANKVTLTFQGKALSGKETEELIDAFHVCSDLDILYVSDENDSITEMEKMIGEKLRDEIVESITVEISELKQKDIDRLSKELDQLKEDNKRLEGKLEKVNVQKERTLSLQKEDKVTFHHSTLRSGQQIVAKHSVIVMGDVNNGARIEADGNVIVLGKLKGVVHAGLKGSDGAYIIALDMNPVQLKINNAYGRAADDSQPVGSKIEPRIAFIDNGRIAIEKIDNKILKEIRELN